MMKNSRNHRGFTIVELLIVIVVIAILAAISVVAYNGIQNRANDTAVQSDLASFGKQLKLMEVDLGAPPAGGAVRTGGVDAGTNTSFPGVTYKPSKGAYITNQNNLYYCTGVETATGQTSFRILAISKSGSTFEYISSGSVRNLGVVGVSSTSCLQLYNNTGSWTYGYVNTGTWHSWTN